MLLSYIITITLLISAKDGSSPGGAAKGKRNAFGFLRLTTENT